MAPPPPLGGGGGKVVFITTLPKDASGVVATGATKEANDVEEARAELDKGDEDNAEDEADDETDWMSGGPSSLFGSFRGGRAFG